MTPQELKNSILQLAIQGKLVPQRAEEGTAEELYNQIQAEKQKLIKAGKIKKEKPLPAITNDEKPFEIPQSWKWVRLGEIISISSGDGLTAKDMDNLGKYPVYGGNGITGYHNLYNVTKNTLVIGRVGFYCGSTHITESKAWITDNAFITKFDEAKIDIKWLKNFIDYLNPRKKASSTAQPVISGKLLYPMLMPLIPLAEQKRIVAKIEEMLPYVERYEKAYNELQQLNKRFPGDLQKSVLQLAIQGRLVPQCPEEGNAEDLYKQIQAEKQNLIKAGKIKKEKPLPAITDDEKPFEIPENWKWVRLGSILNKLVDGTHRTPKYTISGIPFISVRNISNGFLDLSNTKFITQEEHEELCQRCRPEKGDILLSKVGTTGIPAKVNTDIEFSLFVSVALLKFNINLIDIDFLMYIIKTPDFQKQCRNNTRGVGNKNWVIKDIANTVFPLPPLAEQKRIVAKLEEILPLCDKLK